MNKKIPTPQEMIDSLEEFRKELESNPDLSIDFLNRLGLLTPNQIRVYKLEKLKKRGKSK